MFSTLLLDWPVIVSLLLRQSPAAQAGWGVKHPPGRTPQLSCHPLWWGDRVHVKAHQNQLPSHVAGWENWGHQVYQGALPEWGEQLGGSSHWKWEHAGYVASCALQQGLRVNKRSTSYSGPHHVSQALLLIRILPSGAQTLSSGSSGFKNLTMPPTSHGQSFLMCNGNNACLLGF